MGWFDSSDARNALAIAFIIGFICLMSIDAINACPHAFYEIPLQYANYAVVEQH